MFDEKEKLAYFFDKSGKNYNSPLQEMEELLSECFQKETIKDKIILDAGCGIGLASIIFSRWGARKVIGLDISQESLNKAKQLKKEYQIDNIEFLRGDIAQLNFPDNCFDFVFSRGVSPYFPALKVYLNEMTRVAKINSPLIIDFIRKNKINFIQERLRLLFLIAPDKSRGAIAKIFSFLGFPVLKLILGKKAKLSKDKKLEKIVYELFFSPVKITATSITELKNILPENFIVQELNIPNLGLHSPRTSFFVRIIKK